MKILILTQYYPPETGAPQNRLHNLARRLAARGAVVTVLTAMPNYPGTRIYEGYRHRCHFFETIDGIPVYRSWIYVGTSRKILPRLVNYFSFVVTSFFSGLFRLGKFDFIFCESPPLFLGISAWLLSICKGSRMIFNVSDLWPESAEKLGLVTNRMILRMSTRLEEFLYRHSSFITGQTEGIVRNIAERFPGKTVHLLRNGVDVRDLQNVVPLPGWRKVNGFAENDFILIYAGIIGHAQGLEVILRAADILKDEKRIRFVLVGDGPVKEKLTGMKDEMKLERVHFLDPVGKETLYGMIAASDAAIVPLRRLELFKGAIPSKIFENMALKKPVLLGVEGEAKEWIIDRGRGGLAFIPEDPNDLADKVIKLFDNPSLSKELGENGYRCASEYFDLDRIADSFYEKTVTYLQTGKEDNR